MALPVGPTPPSDDVAIQGWSALTVRIAWTLLSTGVKVRSRVLRDARAHVLFNLERRLKLTDAEDIAEALTRQFVRRARGGKARHPHDQDNAMPVSPRWRRALERSLSPLSEAVFRMHYGDNRSLKYVGDRLDADSITLDAACAGLREVVRRQAADDDVPLDGWSVERVDRLLVRLAAWSPGPCPPLLDVVEGSHRQHVASCTRCDRTVRLVRASVLTVEDLLPPSLGARPKDVARVLALHLHPDARSELGALREALPVPAFPVGDDLLLLDAAHLESIEPTLRMVAEIGRPNHEQIRGAIVEGPGRWSPYGILGPLADRADREARYRTWGQIDQLGPLPSTLPAPPSATRSWMAVAALALACVGAWTLMEPPVPASIDHPLEAHFTQARGGVWTHFDAPEAALITVVRSVPSEPLDVVLASTTALDKLDFSVGDGSYRTFTQGSGVLVASTGSHLALEPFIQDAMTEERPLEWLAARIVELEPGADVRIHPR